MGVLYYVDGDTGDIVSAGMGIITGPAFAAAFDTNVANARLNMSGTAVTALGTDANIDINLVPKGTGSVASNRINLTDVIKSPILALKDTDLSNILNVTWGENDVVDRSLGLRVAGGNRLLTISGDSVINQDVSTTGSPIFANLTVTSSMTFGTVSIGPSLPYGGNVELKAATLQTTGNTPTDIVTIAVDEDETWIFKVHVIAEETSTPSTSRAIFDLTGCFYRVTGDDIKQMGCTSVLIEAKSTSAYDCDFTLDVGTQTVSITATGLLGSTVNWKCFYESFKVTNL